jgi:hypothetical protein
MATKAADVVPQVELGQPALAQLQDDMTPEAYLERLVEQHLYRDAMHFLSGWLSRRQTLWWGCLCVWLVHRPEWTPPREAALRAVVQWIQDPSEARRRQAEIAAGAEGTRTPAGALALATFWSEGSMTPPGLPEVLPPPNLSATTVAEAVLLAANLGDPAKKAVLYRQCVRLGLEVAHGQIPWSGSPGKP